MDAIVRALVIYAALMIIFRVSGKRTFAQITTFDFVLLLMVGEATQQALLGDDFSLTNAVLVISTLIGADIVLSLVKRRSPRFDKLVEGVPTVLLEGGKPIEHRMERARVDEADILSAARLTQGIERLDQIKYAVLEQGGSISVIPYGPVNS